MHNGLSVAPIEVGPMFAIRNVFAGYKAHAVKINNGPQGWMLLYHNTSVPADLADAQAFAPSEPFQRMVMRNNIWTGHRYVIESSITPSGPIDLDRDNLFTDSMDGTPRFVKWLDIRYDDLAQLKASNTIEQNGFASQPAYEDPAAGNFTPVAASPLLDVGEPLPGINDRFSVGAGPDLGAFERGGVVPGNDAGYTEGSAGGAAGSGGGGGGTGPADANADQAAGADASGAAATGPSDDGGCGCRLGARPAEASWLVVIAIAGSGYWRARRRRRAPN